MKYIIIITLLALNSCNPLDFGKNKTCTPGIRPEKRVF